MKHAAIAPVRAAVMAAAQRASALAVRTPQITCKPKCSACCKRYVPITLAEALVLIDFLKKHERWDRVAASAEAQRDASMTVRPVAWFKMGLACPILNQDGMCDAYPVRPVACSAHFAVSPPEACGPLSTSFNQFEPCEFAEVHVEFAKAFDTVVSASSSLRIRAPVSAALLMGDKLSITPGPDFDSVITTLMKEFKK